MKTKIDFNKPVKFSQPITQSEIKERYMVLNYNDVTGRVQIQLICDLPIKPVSLVNLTDIENA